jgi:hypothetical protein
MSAEGHRWRRAIRAQDAYLGLAVLLFWRVWTGGAGGCPDAVKATEARACKVPVVQLA